MSNGTPTLPEEALKAAEEFNRIVAELQLKALKAVPPQPANTKEPQPPEQRPKPKN